MADIYLGTTPSATTPLPRIRWTGGKAPGIPIDHSPQVEKARMLDGSTRYNRKSKHPRRWPLEWAMLTRAEFQRFSDLNAENGPLYFQNNWEDATWRRVSIVSFVYDPFLGAGPVGCRWALALTLEEIR